MISFLMDCLSETWLILLFILGFLLGYYRHERKKKLDAIKRYQKADLEFMENLNMFISSSNRKFKDKDK